MIESERSGKRPGSRAPYVRVVTIVRLLSSLFAVVSGFLLVGFAGVGSMDLGRGLALNSLAAAVLLGQGGRAWPKPSPR